MAHESTGLVGIKEPYRQERKVSGLLNKLTHKSGNNLSSAFLVSAVLLTLHAMEYFLM